MPRILFTTTTGDIMRVKTKELKAGDVMASGEVVVWTKAGRDYLGKNVMQVRLQGKGGQQRTSQWNYNGTVSVSVKSS